MKIYKASIPFFVFGILCFILALCQATCLYRNIKPTFKYQHLDDPSIKGTGYFNRLMNVGDTTYYGFHKVILIEK